MIRIFYIAIPQRVHVYMVLLAIHMAIPVNTSATPSNVCRGRSISSPSHIAVAAVKTNVKELHTGTAIEISGEKHNKRETKAEGTWW